MKLSALFSPKTILQLEGLVVLILSAILYGYQGGNWLLYAVLFLAPDLFALGYLAGTNVGSHIYNFAHTYFIPALLVLYGYFAGNPLCISIALIWTSHIAFDRLLSFGLKYPTKFNDTHLQHV